MGSGTAQMLRATADAAGRLSSVPVSRVAALVVTALVVVGCGPLSGASPKPSVSVPPSALVDSTLVLAVDIRGDVEGPLPPLELAVYADGRVLWPTWSEAGDFVIFQGRLSPAGLSAVRDELLGSGLFDFDIDIPPDRTPDPNQGSGFATYTVDLRVGERLVTARTTNIFPSVDGERLIDLAERWSEPKEAVPAGAWDTDASGPAPYEAARWYLQLFPSLGGTLGEPAPDIAELGTILGDPRTFGAPIGPDPAMGRCGVIGSDTAGSLVAFFRGRGGVTTTGHRYSVGLAWADLPGTVELLLIAALPHLADGCP